MKKNILFVEPSTRKRMVECNSPFKHAEKISDPYYSNHGSFVGRVLDMNEFTTEQQEIFDRLIQDLADGSKIYVIPGWDTVYRDLAVTLFTAGFAEQGQIVWFKQSTTKKRIQAYFEKNNIKFDEVWD